MISHHPVAYRELNKLYSFRRSFSVGIAVFIAFMLGYIYSFSNEFWIVLSAFLVSQTTRGTPFRQGMIIFLVMVIALMASSLVLLLKSYNAIYILISILFMGSSYFAFLERPQSSKTWLMIILFGVTLLLATFSPGSEMSLLQDRIFDIAMGAFIGLLCRFVVFPVKWDVEFSEGILPTLTALSEFSRDFSAEKRQQVEDALQNMYPSWIYETGFNRGLRSGFRFFLVNVERVAEILFSMDSLHARGLDEKLLQPLQEDIDIVMQKNQELLMLLIEYFNEGKLSQTNSDFSSDLVDLENAVHRVIPDNMEALIVSEKYLLMTAYIRDVRDLRGLLLSLMKSVA